MKAGSIRDWLPPTLGAALMLAGAAGLAYKVISGYQHPGPEAFISFEDQNKLRAASAADHSVEAPTGSVAPITIAPTLDAASAWDSTSSAAANAGPRAEASGDLACVAIRTEQGEIESASRKTHSHEEDRFFQRRLVELAEQSVKQDCVK